LFHTFDAELELNLNFDNTPKKLVDVETGESIDLYAENIQNNYKLLIEKYFKALKDKCLQYKIDYVPVDIQKGFATVLTNYLISRRKFL
jgi:hypothetical protein